MSQHGRFEQDYLRMKVQIDKLKASGLSEEQRTIFSKLDKMIQHFEHHLFTEYIDFEEICDNLPDAIYVASPDGTTIYVNDTYTIFNTKLSPPKSATTQLTSTQYQPLFDTGRLYNSISYSVEGI